MDVIIILIKAAFAIYCAIGILLSVFLFIPRILCDAVTRKFPDNIVAVFCIIGMSGIFVLAWPVCLFESTNIANNIKTTKYHNKCASHECPEDSTMPREIKKATKCNKKYGYYSVYCPYCEDTTFISDGNYTAIISKIESSTILCANCRNEYLVI